MNGERGKAGLGMPFCQARHLRHRADPHRTAEGCLGIVGETDQLRAADEGGVPFVCLLGKEEVESGTVKLKNMRAGTEETLPRGEGGGLGRAVAERVRKEADEAEAAAAAAAAAEPGSGSSALSSSLVAAGRGAKMASASSGDGGAQS